jgi:hypothetical protein
VRAALLYRMLRSHYHPAGLYNNAARTAHQCFSFLGIRQHTSAYVSIRQHTSAYDTIMQRAQRINASLFSAYVIIIRQLRQHTSAYDTIMQRAQRINASLFSAYVSIRQHTSAYDTIMQRARHQLFFGRQKMLSKHVLQTLLSRLTF